MGRDPDLQLIKAGFELFFELPKESAMLRQILHINKEPGEVVLINRAFMFPSAPHGLSFPRAEPNRWRGSVKVCVSNDSGTRRPSLNNGGTRSS